MNEPTLPPHPPAHRCAAAGAVVLLFLALAAGRPGAAQPAARPDAAAPFGEVVEVQVVLLELLATDAVGQPVPDLDASEVRVLEDGRPVAVESFQRIGGSSAAAPAAAGVPDGPPPLQVAIFIDEVHVGALSRRVMLRRMADALVAELRPVDRVMLATYDGATRVVLPFTSDRAALLKALESVERVSGARLIADGDWRTTMEGLFLDANTDLNSACLHTQSWVRSFAEAEAHRVHSAIDAFGRFVDSLTGIPGRKAVLHVSDGIPARAGAAAAEYSTELCGGSGAILGTPGATDIASQSGIFNEKPAPEQFVFDARFDTTPRWEELTARANAGNVSVYTFQAGPGFSTGGTPADTTFVRQSVERQTLQRGNLQESLFLLADRTGGRAILEGADLHAAVTASLGELRSYYLVSYAMPAPERAEVRRLSVETTRPGVTLRHRKLYRPRSPHQQVADQLLGRLLYGGGEEKPSLRLAMGERQVAAESKVKARFRLEVPLAQLALTEQQELRQGLFTVFVAATDERGVATPVRKTTVPVRIGKPAPEHFRWEVEMLLRPGPHEVAMAVRDELSGEASFVVQRFEVARPR